MFESFLPQLKRFGLSDYEARVYDALLVSSPTNATLLAKKCHLSRSTVYTVLASLTAKGLVGTTYKNAVKQFMAQDDVALEQLLMTEKRQLDEKYAALEKMRTQLHALQSASLHVPQIIFFEGQEGLKKIYLSMMRQAQTGTTVRILRDEFVWQPEWQFVLEKEWHERVKRLKQEKNISTKLLINPSSEERKRVGYYASRKALEYRFLAKQHQVRSFALYIVGDMVSILSMEHRNLVGIHVTNRHLAENFQALFDGLWRRG